jgi:hypothetical protein
MTKEEVLEFLKSEGSAKNTYSRIIRVYLKRDKMLLAYFLNKDQEKPLVAQNQWVIHVLTSRKNEIIKGESIIKLKAGANPSAN